MARWFLICVLTAGFAWGSVLAELGTCGSICHSDDDCEGKRACMSGKCDDDPGEHTNLCKKGGDEETKESDKEDKPSGKDGEKATKKSDKEDKPSGNDGGKGNTKGCGGYCLRDGDCDDPLACKANQCLDDETMHSNSNICKVGGSGDGGSKKRHKKHEADSGGDDGHKEKRQKHDTDSGKGGDHEEDDHDSNGTGGDNTGGGTCTAVSQLNGSEHSCKKDNGAECCAAGKSYPRFSCSPAITEETPATLTLNDFSQGGDGGAESECDSKFHSNTEHVVALSTGWYAKGKLCGKPIRLKAENGKTVDAIVVDECDSMNGCDKEHDYQPPCHNNIVDASSSVWAALGLDKNQGEAKITWMVVSSTEKQ